MAEDFQKNILFTAESKLSTVKGDLLELNQTLEEQLTKQKLLELQGKRNTQAYIEIASQVRITKQEIRNSNKELDNAVRALNSQANSLQQNRALSATLTAELIKLSQTDGATAASTIKLRDALASVNQTIKEQSKAIGDTRPNVGGYFNDIMSAMSQFTGGIPGMQQFGAATQAATKIVGFLPSAFSKASSSISNFLGNPGRNVIQGFGKMEQSAAQATSAVEKTATGLETVAPAAVEAETGMAALGTGTAEAAGGLGAVTAGSVATGGAIAALVGIIAGAAYWFSTLGSIGEKAGQVFNGVKASALAFFNDLQKGDMKNLANDMKLAYNNGVELKKGMQELDRTKEQSDITVAYYDEEINKNMQALRYKKITLEEAKKIDKETEKLESDRVGLKQKNLRTEFELSVESAVNGKKLRQQQLNQIKETLYSGNLAQIQQLELHDKINKGAAKELHDIELQIIAAREEGETSMQKTINRQAIIEQRFGKAAAKFDEAQTKELAQANANIREAEQTRMQSIARQAEFTMSTYGKELAATDAHYKDLIYRQLQFVAKQQSLAKLAKSPDAKAKFLQARDKGLKAINQIESEWETNLQKVIADNTEKVHEMFLRSADELQQATIENIKDAEQKQIATIQLQEQIRIEAFKQEKSDREREIQELKNQAATASADEKNSLLQRANELLQIQKNANAIMVQEAQKASDDIKKVQEKAARDNEIVQDKIKLLQVTKTGSNNPFDEKKLEAEKQLLADEAAAEISQQGLTEAQSLLIYQEYLNKKKQLDDQYAKNKRSFEINFAAQMADDAFNILQQSLQRSNQANEVNMERQKNHELQNQSLTETQKYQINEKYRVLEGQEKVKEFNQEKELNIAKALMAGAKAVVEDLGDPWKIPFDIATTAAEVAVIASQKAPAYAKGGLHYTSDGRGGVLPGYSKTDNTNAFLRSGEGIVVSEAMQVPWARKIVSDINQMHGGRPFDGAVRVNSWFTPGFASGGVFKNYAPVSDSGLRPQLPGLGNARLHPDDVNMIINGFATAINNMPAPITDVKDINYQQARNSNVYDRATY